VVSHNDRDHDDATQVVSASDDASCLLWDARQKRPTAASLDHTSPVTAVCADDTYIYTACLDHLILCWDIRNHQKVYGCKGHSNIITCLALNTHNQLLSNSMDQSLKIWNVQPYCAGKRLEQTLVGHKHNVEKGLLKCAWNVDGTQVSAGSADSVVHIWDAPSGQELYTLPGHAGCVNAVAFHPEENVIASGASDQKVFVGELS